MDAARESLLAQLELARSKGQTEYEERLSVELGKQREATTKELRQIHDSLKLVHDRECAALKEAREASQAEADRLREVLAAAHSGHEGSVQRAASERAKLEQVSAELRAELRVRSHELATLGIAHEAKAAEARDAALQVTLASRVRLQLLDVTALRAPSRGVSTGR